MSQKRPNNKAGDQRGVLFLGQIQDEDGRNFRYPTDFELEMMIYESEVLTEEEYDSMTDEEFLLWQKEAKKIVKKRMANNL